MYQFVTFFKKLRLFCIWTQIDTAHYFDIFLNNNTQSQLMVISK